MGASFETYEIQAMDRVDLREKVRQLIRHYQYESGHGGYTGTVAESNGSIIIPFLTICSWQEAEKYIHDHAEKWGSSIAIRIEGPGFPWLVGGWYSC